MQVDNLNELIHREEEICDELRPFVRKGPRGPMIHSPLLINLFHDPKRAALSNAQYKHKKVLVAECLLQKKWMAVLTLTERPYRFDTLIKLRPKMSETRFWRCLGWLWCDSENIWESLSEWEQLLIASPSRHSRLMMSKEERARLDLLHKCGEVTVYRGAGIENCKGLSWTLSKAVAQKFATRYNKDGWVLEGVTAATNIILFFSSRSEEEVVIDHRHIHIVRNEKKVKKS